MAVIHVRHLIKVGGVLLCFQLRGATDSSRHHEDAERHKAALYDLLPGTAAFRLTDGTNGGAMLLVTRALQSKPLNQACDFTAVAPALPIPRRWFGFFTSSFLTRSLQSLRCEPFRTADEASVTAEVGVRLLQTCTEDKSRLQTSPLQHRRPCNRRDGGFEPFEASWLQGLPIIFRLIARSATDEAHVPPGCCCFLSLSRHITAAAAESSAPDMRSRRELRLRLW